MPLKEKLSNQLLSALIVLQLNTHILKKHCGKEALGENVNDAKSSAYLKHSSSSASDFIAILSFENISWYLHFVMKVDLRFF